MATFLGELEEHVQSLNRDLLELERGPAEDRRAELLLALFRTAHSLKGAARSVQVELVENACHRLEELLAEVRAGRIVLSGPAFSTLYAVSDALQDAGRRIRDGVDMAEAPLAKLLPHLDRLAFGRLGGGSAAEPSFSAPVREPAPPHAPAPVPTPAPATPPKAVGGAGSVRLDVERLDALLVQSGELVMASQRLGERESEAAALQDEMSRAIRRWRGLASGSRRSPDDGASRAGVQGTADVAFGELGPVFRQLASEAERLSVRLSEEGGQLRRAAAALDAEVRGLRMLPFIEVCDGLERVVRDIATSRGTEAVLEVRGRDVELDRLVLAALKDPLTHLVRNATGHGLESARERRDAGKDPVGRIVIAAELRGSQVAISVADDGRGLDLLAIRARARELGIPEPATERELARLVFLPGFSTAVRVTELSGRGIGLNVVASKVEAVHGAVDVWSERGRGTRFELVVPLTLTTIRSLLVVAGGQPLAVPFTNIHSIRRVEPSDVVRVESGDTISLEGEIVPLSSLARVLGLADGSSSVASGAPVVVLVSGGRLLAVAVEEVISEQDVVVKTLGRRIRKVKGLSGATLLGDGRIALLLNVADLLRAAREISRVDTTPRDVEGTASVDRPRVLVVDDSVTTRSLVKSVLEAAGYRVLAAADGAEAWRMLQEHGADLVVADVEMPRMTGFELTDAIRRSRRFAELPVVLVTGLEKDEDRRRGLEAGADAYLGKSTFDQARLLDVISQIL